MSNTSRTIKQTEKDACTKNNITDIVELQVAVDALSVIVNRQNTWAQCMTPAQLQMLFKDGGAKKWSDVDPSWPDDDIKFYYPGTDSGTFDYFKEAIITLAGKDTAAKHRGDGTSSEDDNVLLRAVENEKNGFAYYQEAAKKLKAVEVNDANKGCVAPSANTVLAGTYTPLARPLFIYTRETYLRERPEVLGFVNFFLENGKKLVPEVGYVTMKDETLAAQVVKLTPFIK
ncbi:MAG: protein sphX [Dehalococcoidia bacterium]|nr:protein sphX [Dehalococcoidia bacterium]